MFLTTGRCIVAQPDEAKSDRRGNPNSSDFIQRRRSILFPCPIDSRSELRLAEKGRVDAGESRIFERSATMNKRVRSFFIGVGLMASLSPGSALAQNVLLRQEAGKTLEVSNVKVDDGTVTGELRNNSGNAVRDAQVLIRYTWLWKNEFHPGSDDPSRSASHTAPGEM